VANSRVILSVAVVGVLAAVLLAGAELVSSRPYEIGFPPASSVRIRFKSSHPDLAEHDREVVFTNHNGKSLSAKLFPDTGGYARSQLYESRDGKFYLQGYFDVAVLDAGGEFIKVGSYEIPSSAKYIGAVDFVSKVGLRYLSPADSPEQHLVAKGG
jgi:hypothetical protein